LLLWDNPSIAQGSFPNPPFNTTDGFDTSTTQRVCGGNLSNDYPWGDRKSLDLWTCWPSNIAYDRLYILNDLTAVELLSFKASGPRNLIIPRWEMASGVNYLGFDLCCASKGDGFGNQVNEDLILSEVVPGSSSGVVHACEDLPVADKTYFYWLKIVDIDG
jgi:hypothetical protein